MRDVSVKTKQNKNNFKIKIRGQRPEKGEKEKPEEKGNRFG